MTIKEWWNTIRGKQINLPVPIRRDLFEPQFIGNSITLYSADTGDRFITKGYDLNDAVYSIVSKNSEKASQVRLYHAKVKRDERKTLQEYQMLQKHVLSPKVMFELKRMQKAMTEDIVATSPLQRLLNKPSRYQTQSEWIEQGFALRELQGEMNIWQNRGLDGKQTLEMLIIPKPHLALIGNPSDPWDVVAYEFMLNGSRYRWEKDSVMTWKYNNPGPISTTFEHMRGMAPLTSAMVLLQAMNEADLRVATSNKNGGALGFAFREDALQTPTPEQRDAMRKQFNDAVNSSEMTNKVAILAGKWGYYNLGLSIKAMELLDQYGYGFKRMCRVFKTPAGIFDEGNTTWDNQKQFFRNWIYSKIAPNMYNLRGMLSDRLIPEFGLDPETNLIDCDVMSLQELSQDLKEQVDAVKEAWWLTPNQKAIATGYEPVPDPNMDKIYIPSGYMPLDQMNEPINPPLDNELNMLGGNDNG